MSTLNLDSEESLTFNLDSSSKEDESTRKRQLKKKFKTLRFDYTQENLKTNLSI